MKGGIIYNGKAYHFDGRDPSELVYNQDGTISISNNTDTQSIKNSKCEFCTEPCNNDWCCTKDNDE